MGRFNLQNLIVIIRESLFLSCIIGINVLFVFLGLNFLDTIFLIIIDILLLSHYLYRLYLSRKVRKNFNVIGFLFFPVFITLICILIYYFFIETGIIGGTLVIPITIIFSSFVIINSLLKLIKNRKKINKISNNKQINVLTLFFQQLGVLVITFMLFFIFVLSPGIIILINTASSNNECKIKCIVLDLIKDCNNDTQKVDALLSWFEKNLSEPNFVDMNYRALHEKAYFRFSGRSYIYEKTPHLCFRCDANPHWIINSRCGRCGEQADLFFDMATKAGLRARKIHCVGEDHDWNEVYISETNEWIPIDPSAVNSANGNDGLVKYDFMEWKVAGDLRDYYNNPNIKTGNVSYVYASYYERGVKKTMDRTRNYTDTTNITLNVTDKNGNSIEGVKVKVFSYNRLGMYDFIGKINTTNSTGQCTFEIGGGEYHFELQKGDLTTVTTNKSNYNETLKHHLEDIEYDGQIEDNKLYERIMSVVIIGMIIAIILYYIGIRTPPRKPKK